MAQRPAAPIVVPTVLLCASGPGTDRLLDTVAYGQDKGLGILIGRQLPALDGCEAACSRTPTHTRLHGYT